MLYVIYTFLLFLPDLGIIGAVFRLIEYIIACVAKSYAGLWFNKSDDPHDASITSMCSLYLAYSEGTSDRRFLCAFLPCT